MKRPQRKLLFFGFIHTVWLLVTLVSESFAQTSLREDGYSYYIEQPSLTFNPAVTNKAALLWKGTEDVQTRPHGVTKLLSWLPADWLIQLAPRAVADRRIQKRIDPRDDNQELIDDAADRHMVNFELSSSPSETNRYMSSIGIPWSWYSRPSKEYIRLSQSQQYFSDEVETSQGNKIAVIPWELNSSGEIEFDVTLGEATEVSSREQKWCSKNLGFSGMWETVSDWTVLRNQLVNLGSSKLRFQTKPDDLKWREEVLHVDFEEAVPSVESAEWQVADNDSEALLKFKIYRTKMKVGNQALEEFRGVNQSDSTKTVRFTFSDGKPEGKLAGQLVDMQSLKVKPASAENPSSQLSFDTKVYRFKDLNITMMAPNGLSVTLDTPSKSENKLRLETKDNVADFYYEADSTEKEADVLRSLRKNVPHAFKAMLLAERRLSFDLPPFYESVENESQWQILSIQLEDQHNRMDKIVMNEDLVEKKSEPLPETTASDAETVAEEEEVPRDADNGEVNAVDQTVEALAEESSHAEQGLIKKDQTALELVQRGDEVRVLITLGLKGNLMDGKTIESVLGEGGEVLRLYGPPGPDGKEKIVRFIAKKDSIFYNKNEEKLFLEGSVKKEEFEPGMYWISEVGIEDSSRRKSIVNYAKADAPKAEFKKASSDFLILAKPSSNQSDKNRKNKNASSQWTWVR